MDVWCYSCPQHQSQMLTRVKTMAPIEAYSMWSHGICTKKRTLQWWKPWKVVVLLFTSARTHICERQHNGCNEAGDKYHNAEDTEQALALGEVNLERETTGGYVNTRVTAQIQTRAGHLKLISPLSGTHTKKRTFVWKQKTVTAMQTTAVIPRARNTAFVL